ncbi:hypothetical protein AB0M46_44475 [Dactylosporangium sp. NPDC051485]|uniref:hypothetical protein n=1 Tax=Dactylosporangium sp. NPDC051485 TaxID=3154846 RepID=UPI00341457B2
MGIDANGYCTQCRTYRGVPQAPQQPTSGTPYSGAPYGGQQPYAGYPASSTPSYPEYPASSVPSYSDPISAPPSAYGATYGGSGGGSSRNKYLTPILALSGVLVVLVVAIVVVAVVKKGGDDKKADPQAGGPTGGATATATAKATGKPTAAIDTCVIGTWNTTQYTIQQVVENVGNVPITLQKNGSTVKLTPEGHFTETYKDSTFTGNPTVQGTAVPITITINGTVTGDVATSNGSFTYTNVSATGTTNLKAPSANIDETDPLDADDSPAKYSCSGSTLTIIGPQFTQTLSKSS